MKLTDFKALTFDVYGTLIDWETGLIQSLKPLTDRVSAGLTRDDILQAHARCESDQQKWTPAKRYSEILAIVYKRLAELWQVPVSWHACLAYGQSIQNWPAFPDAPAALQYLQKHYRLFILSNVDHESFHHSQAKLQVQFDGAFTAEDIGSYKPSPKNFQYMLEQLGHMGVTKDQILHTAESMFHDHAPANDISLASCHIYRRHAQTGFGATREPEAMPDYQFQFPSMAAMVKAHQDEMLSASNV